MTITLAILLALAATSTAIEPSCPTGFVSGYNGQTLDIIAKPETVWSLVGDFGNLTWAGVTQVNLSDPAMDNVPGVSRTSVQLGFFINETLIIADGYDTNTMVGSETHTVAPFSTAPLVNTTVSAYSDSLTVSPLCNGLATRMTFNVGFCTMPGFEPAISTLFTEAHFSQLQSAQAILGAANYTDSSCALLTGTSGSNGTSMTNSTGPSNPPTYRNSTTGTTGSGNGSTTGGTTTVSSGSRPATRTNVPVSTSTGNALLPSALLAMLVAMVALF